MTILAFAASTSSKSINRKLVIYAATFLEQDVEIVDLNDFALPLFSEDIERELGQPAIARAFIDKIKSSTGVMISFAEHNGSYSAAYKNLFDWCSRIETKVFQQKPVVFLSTSPGTRGGASVLEIASRSAPFFGAELVGSLAIPSFHQNFDQERQSLSDSELNGKLIILINEFNNVITH
ncbi:MULTISPECIES: NADPH-dependent FMN reductase [Serratia]|uniref:NADPH-dependent FMN reductase n=1 Tax=Serratia TaxID=613 RepID=UPI0004670852|nr:MULTISPECIES: NAD(P)H-dependent oxidoreductase [Serratia]UAN62218.1 NAD(P)H-dependent oxidoreductase [Serratia sp. JSRIV006]